MTKFRMSVVVALAGVATLGGSALAASAAPPKTIKFSATYAGKAVVRVTDSKADISSATATGKGTLVGKSKLSGKGAGLGSDPCATFGGPGTITAANGKLNFVITPTGGSACGDESGETFALSGRATVKGGTGRYLKAKGSFKFVGTFSRSSGVFSVKFLGTLTV